MEAITSVVSILVLIVVVGALFAIGVGALASTRFPLAVKWSSHPWRVMWISFGGLMVGAVALASGLTLTGITILAPAMLAIYGSAVWGLRSTWHRSRSKAIIILAAAGVMLLVSRISQWAQKSGTLRDLDVELFSCLFALVAWGVAAGIADRTYARMQSRSSQSTSSPSIVSQP